MKHQEQSQGPMVVNVAADYRQRRIELGFGTSAAGMAAGMLALTAIQEPIGWSWLAWVSLVGWVVAYVGVRRGGHGAAVCYAMGFVYFLGNLYWLVWVTPAGWIGLCFYLAWYFVLCGYILRRVYLTRRWPFTLVLPVVWVGQEYLRATLMTGFPWLFLGHSQHANARLIQICDVFGVYGVTFLVAMVNGLICDLLLRPLRQKQGSQGRKAFSSGTLVLLTVCCVAGAMLYGRSRLNQGQKTITKGATVAVIQEVIPQYVKEAGESNEEIFMRHLKLSEQALAAVESVDLIVWPETMVPGFLNSEFINYPPEELAEIGQKIQAEVRSYDRRLRWLAAKGSAVLVGAAGIGFDEPGCELHYNSAFLYLSGGERYREHYDKMHLVPFGEVVPFRKSWPWLYRQLNRLTPYDYEYSLEAGVRPSVFEFTGGDGVQSRFGVAICYEDVTPWVPRRLACMEEDRKRVDFLLNISNDGWFVRGGKGEPVKSSTELIQHLVICKFRAVENRVGIARAVNTGISAFVRPDGYVEYGALSGTLPEDPANRQGVSGYLIDNVYYDSRVTTYSRIGDSFAICCTVVMVLLVLTVLVSGRQSLQKS